MSASPPTLKSMAFPYENVVLRKLWPVLAVAKACHFLIVAYLLSTAAFSIVQLIGAALYEPRGDMLISIMSQMLIMSIAAGIPLAIIYFVVKAIGFIDKKLR
jgi:hypothetical protein